MNSRFTVKSNKSEKEKAANKQKDWFKRLERLRKNLEGLEEKSLPSVVPMERRRGPCGGCDIRL